MFQYSPIKAILTGTLLLAGSAMFAQTVKDPSPLLVGLYPTKQAEKICLAIEKQPNTDATIELLAPSGDELYAARLPKKEAKCHQLFNLNELENGTYTFRVKQGKTVIVKSIRLENSTPEPVAPTRTLTLGN